MLSFIFVSLEMPLFPSILYWYWRSLSVWRVRRTFSLPDGVFYLVTTGWIFDTRLCEKFIQSTDKPKFFKATRHAEIRKNVIPMSIGSRPRAGEASAQAGIQPSKAMRIPENAPETVPVCRSLLAFVGRKHTDVRDQLSPQKSPKQYFLFLYV